MKLALSIVITSISLNLVPTTAIAEEVECFETQPVVQQQPKAKPSAAKPKQAGAKKAGAVTKPKSARTATKPKRKVARRPAAVEKAKTKPADSKIECRTVHRGPVASVVLADNSVVIAGGKQPTLVSVSEKSTPVFSLNHLPAATGVPGIWAAPVSAPWTGLEHYEALLRPDFDWNDTIRVSHVVEDLASYPAPDGQGHNDRQDGPIDDVAVTPGSVPVPGTLALCAIGLWAGRFMSKSKPGTDTQRHKRT